MGSIFGGPGKSKSESGNYAYGAINNATAGSVPAMGESTNLLRSFLSGDRSGVDTFKNTMGYNPAMEAAGRGVTANAAAKGILNSGATGKNLLRVGSQINDQYNDMYLDAISKLFAQGQGAGALLSSAGQYSKGSSTESGKSGLGNALSLGANVLAMSDRRVKENIVKIREEPDGLGVYEYNYKWDKTPRIGVMADEVAKLRPEALGPTLNGYMTVDYGKLGGNYESR